MEEVNGKKGKGKWKGERNDSLIDCKK